MAMRPFELFQRYMIKRARARQRGMAPRALIDFAIALCGFGALALVLAAVWMRAPGLGLELGSRLVFALLVLVAVRPWVAR
jgi:hypothetical protein